MEPPILFFFRSAFAADNTPPALGGGSGQLDPATLQARRALAEKLKQEVIGNEDQDDFA